MSQNPKITFIICTYNRAHYIDDTLHSLMDQDDTNAPIELLVIDNNSTDNTADIVQRHQSVTGENDKPIRYIKEKKQGLSHARNRGIKESKAPYVVFLDDDIRAGRSLISAWVSFFNKNPNAIAGGGKIHVQFDDPRPSWMSHFLLPLLGHHDLGNTHQKYPATKYPFGGNMGFKKEIFTQIGGFDIDLGRKGESLNAGEEKELFNRIRDRGNALYFLPDALLYHRVSAQRLTINYIRKQAVGLGQSMKLRLKNASLSEWTLNWLSEMGKLAASFPLGLGYLLGLQPAKAKLLFQFRWWIWKGYYQSD